MKHQNKNVSQKQKQEQSNYFQINNDNQIFFS